MTSEVVAQVPTGVICGDVVDGSGLTVLASTERASSAQGAGSEIAKQCIGRIAVPSSIVLLGESLGSSFPCRQSCQSWCPRGSLVEPIIAQTSGLSDWSRGGYVPHMVQISPSLRMYLSMSHERALLVADPEQSRWTIFVICSPSTSR